MRAAGRGYRPPHELLAGRSFYPPALGLLAGRVTGAESRLSAFLARNLSLAWIDYLAILWATIAHHRLPGQVGTLFLPGVVWLAFFPNAPCLVTDLTYVGRGDPAFFWYDLALLAIFALAHCAPINAPLGAMPGSGGAARGAVTGWLRAARASVLGGVGSYLGRFHRRHNRHSTTKPHARAADLAGARADRGGTPAPGVVRHPRHVPPRRLSHLRVRSGGRAALTKVASSPGASAAGRDPRVRIVRPGVRPGLRAPFCQALPPLARMEGRRPAVRVAPGGGGGQRAGNVAVRSRAGRSLVALRGYADCTVWLGWHAPWSTAAWWR